MQNTRGIQAIRRRQDNNCMTDWTTHRDTRAGLTKELLKTRLVWKGYTGNLYETEKALYGNLQEDLLFCKVLTGKLKDWGFKLNPYDECVINRNIDGLQYTILWYMNELNIYHMIPKVVENIVDFMNEKYGREAPLTVTRVKVHYYLVNKIYYQQQGSCSYKWTTTSRRALKRKNRIWWARKRLPPQDTNWRRSRTHNFCTITQSNNSRQWRPNCSSF